jgi:D-alanyl-D-alanine dipeptidase
MSHAFTEVPIPDLAELRAIKHSYPDYPIDSENPLFDEPVVSLHEYGIAGISYYSQPHRATGEPVPGVRPEPLVRRSVAEKLFIVKDTLSQSDDLTRILGGRAVLIVRDALRSRGLQQHLFDVILPNVLRTANPDWDEARVQAELPNLAARPSDKPTPHMTGAAVDVDLIREDGSRIDFGKVLGTATVQTDYHEGRALDQNHPLNPAAQKVRRALYWAMLDQGFANHPYEFWHYSYGDQMWALFSGAPAALYGEVEAAPDLVGG